MHTENRPLVSIGLPVYNGGQFLRQALGALIAQDYPDLELIISDNASEDDTAAICREFQSQDARIHYIRQSENQGAPFNGEFVARQARGEYFMWAAHDDFWEPSYVRKCVEMLEAYPQAVLCCTELNLINGEGQPAAGFRDYKNIGTLGMTPVQRIHELICRMGWFAIYGLMRREATLKLSLGISDYGPDVIQLLELLLMGDFAKVNERLFTYRILKPEKTAEDYKAAFKSNAPATTTPYTDLAVSLLRTVYKSNLSSRQKVEALAEFVLTLTRQNTYWRWKITRELLEADAVSDSDFSHLLCLALSRSVPLTEFKRNPLLQASFNSKLYMPDLVPLAAKILEMAASETPGSFEGKRHKAVQLFAEGNFAQASSLFGAALLERETSELWSDWATCRLASNENGQAEHGLRRALGIDSNNAQAAAKLGILLANLGRTEEAIPYLEQIERKIEIPQRSAVLDLLEGCRAKLGCSDSAETALR